ncbi:MAG: polyprenyl synthetase family protein [Chitinispirillaceae bacterium]|nr:polyprenyl synthetase family protein [Chitinispirillaceae bacterium]
MNEVKTYLNRVAEAVETILDELLPKESEYPPSIHTLMRYTVFAGGKRLRPALLMAAYEACGGTFGDRPALAAGAALEMFHTFSLIHDDLPCMDDDDLRRGRPTAHKAFNEALAVLGGDALCIAAFEVLANTGNISLIIEIASALGTNGMLGGQVVDIESEGKKVDRATVEYIHKSKTAALIRSSVRMGAMLAGASVDTLEKLSSFGGRIGLAFQVVDDILDEESTTEQLGKDAGSDRERGKATFPAICGMKASKQYARELVDRAWKDIAFLNERGDLLHRLAGFIITRIS